MLSFGHEPCFRPLSLVHAYIQSFEDQFSGALDMPVYWCVVIVSHMEATLLHTPNAINAVLCFTDRTDTSLLRCIRHPLEHY